MLVEQDVRNTITNIAIMRSSIGIITAQPQHISTIKNINIANTNNVNVIIRPTPFIKAFASYAKYKKLRAPDNSDALTLKE